MTNHNDRRGHNAVKGKQGFQEITKDEPADMNLAGQSDTTFLSIPVGELRPGDKVYDEMADEFWTVISIDNDHKSTSVEVDTPEYVDGFLTFRGDQNVSVERQNSEVRAIEHDDMVAVKEREAANSFERSDTDGFMSQWASGISAQRHRLEAELERNGGVHKFPALFDLEGNLVPAKIVEGRYGAVWAVLEDSEDPHGPVTDWVSMSKARNAARRRQTMEAKGYREGFVRAPAKVKTVGSGTGLSGALSVHAVIARADGGFSPDAEIVSADDPGDDY